jgi:hypothetical protein
MAKYKNQTSAETIKQAEQVAKATQKPGQTKAQSKLIAQGIQKGIEHYKKQQKAKARNLDKKLKSLDTNAKQAVETSGDQQEGVKKTQGYNWRVFLPWLLLAASWLYFFKLL